MNEMIITDNYAQQVTIGKEIWKEKQNVYSDRMTKIINDTITLHMKDSTEKEKEDVFFHSVYDYWVYGNNIGEEFFYDFLHKTDKEKKEYITFRGRFLYVNHLNSQKTRHYLDNKWDAYQLMKPYYRREAILIRDLNDYEQFIEFSNRHRSFAVKPVGLGLAIGVHKASISEGGCQETFHKILEERDQLHSQYPWGDSTAMMLEEIIQQDERMAALHPDSAQTVRLVTIRVGDKVNIWYPRIHIGRGKSFLINGAAGGLMALVDPKTGIVKSKGKTEGGETFEYHPDTGVKIVGFHIPEWDKLIDMTTELMLNVVKDTNYVGWDMSLTPQGWCVVEGNWAGEFVGDQLELGRGLRRELEQLLKWTPFQKYWWEK